MLDIENSLVLAIDIQEKLVNAVEKHSPVAQACKILKGADILGIPAIITEQYPRGLGETVSELKKCSDAKYFEKTSFSAIRTPEIVQNIEQTGRKQIVIFGIEAHICVYQTICDLLARDYDVYFVKDCSASRHKNEFKTGVELIKQVGAKVTCAEIVLFEWLKSSGHPKFKEVQALIK